jgi:tRNA pseudouridine38-40 synthase
VKVLKLTLEYDGTDFSGWQAQPGRRTVQAVLEEAAATIFRHRTSAEGAGRTDAGVHALGQVASIETASELPAAKVLRALNGVLPEDVAVRAVEEAPAGFHARFSARAKHYRYRILTSNVRAPLEARFAWHCHHALDEMRMQHAADLLVGPHDFRAFAREPDARSSTCRTLYALDVRRAGTILTVDVKGDGFLYNMVRALAGTLVEVGRGRLTPGEVSDILAARERQAAGPTLPPQGLFLVEVVY